MAVVEAHSAAVQFDVCPKRHVGRMFEVDSSFVHHLVTTQSKIAKVAALSTAHIKLGLITGEMPHQPRIQRMPGRQEELLQADDIGIQRDQVTAHGIGQFQTAHPLGPVRKESHVVGDHLERRFPFGLGPGNPVVSARKKERRKEHQGKQPAHGRLAEKRPHP